jgi:lysophospholipase L1-like esterase
VAGLLAFLIAGCSLNTPDHPKLNVEQPTGKDVGSNYVAIGDNSSAGFMDGGLHVAGQINSYAALVSSRLGYLVQPLASATFTQPWVDEPGIGNSDTGDPDMFASTLYWDGTTITFDSYPATQVQDLLLGVSLPVPYENMGVPGALLGDVNTRLTSTTSTVGDVPEQLQNPFFDFILRNPTFGDVTMQGQAVGKGSTLVTLWIGNNDVLSGATSGNPLDGVNVTPATLFEQMYGQLLDSIDQDIQTRFGYVPTIVVANIPGVASAPFFIPKADWDALPLPPVVFEEDPDDQGLIAYVLFPALSLMSQPTPPDTLGTEYSLTNTEAALVTSRIGEYNSSIASLAAARSIEVVNVFQLLDDLDPPQNSHFLLLVQDGMDPVQAALTTLFSLDGIHLNNRGNVTVANAFITAINAALGLTGSDAYGSITTTISPWDPTYGRNDGGLTTIAGEVRFPSLETSRQMIAIFGR